MNEAAHLSALALSSKAHWGYSPEFLAACRTEMTYSPERLEAPELAFWVAEEGLEVVGFHALEFLSEHLTELEALYVLPSRMGRGIGRALLDHAQEHARSRGARSMLIQSDPHAERFYRAAGAVRIGERVSGSIPGRSLPLLSIDLHVPGAASPAPPREAPLPGGNSTPVQRVGETVRRTAGPWTPTLHRLLAHVIRRGVSWVPNPLGMDDSGREILSYLEGEVPHEATDWLRSTRVLTDLARALRTWHDASSDFDTRAAVWQLPPNEPHEVICHNDFAPYNCVFREGRLVGVIDFDTCSPGPRSWDIAYTAYRVVPLRPPRARDGSSADGECGPLSAAEQRTRLAYFLDAYASGEPHLRTPPAACLRMCATRLRTLAAWTEKRSAESSNPQLKAHAAMYRAHATWLDETPELEY